MEPFYFGSADRPLFGCYHGPESGFYQDCGIVMCHSIGHEYIQCHHAFQQLALRLCHLGFPVLRFDFHGCGDSGGDCEDSRILEWESDISNAIEEIRRRRPVPRICLIGLRLGGSLSAMVGAQRRDIDSMVLWDPVVSGKNYIKELRELHREMLRYSHVRVKSRPGDKEQTEILGFPFTDLLIAEIEHFGLLAAVQEKPATDVFLIESNERAGQAQLNQHLNALGVRVQYQRLPNPDFWMWIEDLARVLVPHEILQSILSWMSRGGE